MAKTRFMTGPECKEADRVFKGSLDFTKVRIADDLGAGDRPYTGAMSSAFTLHVGDMYNGILWSPEYTATLMHELTHAWQGQHSMIRFGYMIKSGLSQFFEGLLCHGEFSAAYRYQAGMDWGAYNVEQQAHIVEDWYKQGLDENDELFLRYISKVRRGETD
jgi:hypothetical protein